MTAKGHGLMADDPVHTGRTDVYDGKRAGKEMDVDDKKTQKITEQ